MVHEPAGAKDYHKAPGDVTQKMGALDDAGGAKDPATKNAQA